MQIVYISIVIMNVKGTQLQRTVCESAVCLCEYVYAMLFGIVWVLQTELVIQQDDSYSY